MGMLSWVKNGFFFRDLSECDFVTLTAAVVVEMTKRKRPAVVARGGKENPVKVSRAATSRAAPHPAPQQVQPLKRSTRKRCAEQTGAAASQAGQIRFCSGDLGGRPVL